MISPAAADNDDEYEDEDESADPTGSTTSSKELIKKRPTPEVLQACISLLAVQPLLPGKGMEGGAEAWEEICCAEVGGWGT